MESLRPHATRSDISYKDTGKSLIKQVENIAKRESSPRNFQYRFRRDKDVYVTECNRIVY
jgi:hypothetical protein